MDEQMSWTNQWAVEWLTDWEKARGLKCPYCVEIPPWAKVSCIMCFGTGQVTKTFLEDTKQFLGRRLDDDEKHEKV